MQDSPHIQILKFQGHAANEWDDFVFAYSPGNLWQSWRWGDYQQLLGRRLWRFALTVDGQIEGLAQIIEMSTFWGHKTALLSNGPVLSPIGLPHANVLLQNLRRLLQAPKVMRLLIEPSSLLPQSPLFWKPLRTSNSQPLAAVPSFAMAVPRAAATLQEAFTARARAALQLPKEQCHLTHNATPNALQSFYNLPPTTSVPGLKSFDSYKTLLDCFAPTNQIEIIHLWQEKTTITAALLLFCDTSCFVMSTRGNQSPANLLLVHEQGLAMAQDRGALTYLVGDPIPGLMAYPVKTASARQFLFRRRSYYLSRGAHFIYRSLGRLHEPLNNKAKSKQNHSL